MVGAVASHDRWVAVKTLIAAFGGRSDFLSYLPLPNTEKSPLTPHSSNLGPGLQAKAKKHAAARLGKASGRPADPYTSPASGALPACGTGCQFVACPSPPPSPPPPLLLLNCRRVLFLTSVHFSFGGH